MRTQDKKLLELLDKSGKGLHRLLTRLTLNEQTAEDLMQELFLKLGSSGHIENIMDLDAYAYRSAVNLAFDWRRRNTQNTVSIEQISEPTSQEASPLDSTIQTEELEEILNAVGQMDGTSRDAFVMRHIQQQSYDTIAKVLGQTEHQARALCHKGLQRLRQLLRVQDDQVGKKGTD
ncbi:MAG: sigma-70 family RNA polymerase sigma factor [Sedimentisphaerales bacterium]